MSDHQRYRQLASLAHTGDLDRDELQDLADHLRECSECQSLLQDYAAIQSDLSQARVLHAAAMLDLDDDTPLEGVDLLRQRDAKHHVLARLSEAGAVRRPDASGRERAARVDAPRITYIAWASAVAVAIVLIAGTWLIWRERGHAIEAQAKARAAEAQALTMRRAFEASMQRIQALESAQSAALAQLDAKSRDTFLLAQQGTRQSSELRDLESARQADLSMLGEQGDKLKALRAELESVRLEAATLAGQKRDLETRAQEGAKSSASQSAEQLRRIGALEARIQDLSRKTQDQEALIARQEKLLATDRDIRELIGARNLTILDVADNSGGRQEPWFGRVFYSQGRSLIFYAFGLERTSVNRNAAFQVWGERMGGAGKPRSLGFFYFDQKTKDRWILKFDEPDVLAQINRVFITVEPPGGSAKPNGIQLLSAVFGLPANHP